MDRVGSKKGDARAKSNLGWLYYKGWGTQKDVQKAFYWTQQAAKQGNIPSYNNLGFYYSHGIGVPVDWKKGAEYYQLAADNGYADAYQNLAIIYSQGKGVLQNQDRALELAKKAVDNGNQLAIYNVGTIYASMGKYDDAILWLRKAADLNISVAQAELAGLLVKIGKNEKDREEAKQWLFKSLEQDDAYAYSVAGVMYSEKNDTFPYDEAKAFDYYLKAAEMGEETAQTLIGLWYLNGKHVMKDEKKALEWFERSANNGEIKAAKKLVEIYGNGTKDIPKNEAKKQYWKNKLVVE
ncbi:tetratricopeptide repeat protein [Neisseria dumasiana]|uniref:tetratricopeptide repeat protein n=1 Tax=Neisseria dumasiana TaxID=1931275 RepID=UPI000A191062|nr:SEL1-like repeat protein [Neisseria dumasiana]